MRGDGNHRNTFSLRAFPVADNVARVGGRAQPFARHSRPVQQALIPVIGVDVHHLRGGGVGVFPVQLAGQAVIQVVRHQQRVRHLAQQFWLLFGQRAQLVERIERQKLDAAAPVDLFAAQRLLGARHDALGAAVAVSDRQANALALFINQYIVDAPGINADGIDGGRLVAGLLQPEANFAFQRIHVPDVVAVDAL